MNTEQKKASLHKDVDVSQCTPQFQEVYNLAKELGMKVESLCVLAGIPATAANNWRKSYNPLLSHVGRLDQIRAAAAAEKQRRLDAELEATRVRLAELEAAKAAQV